VTPTSRTEVSTRGRVARYQAALLLAFAASGAGAQFAAGTPPDYVDQMLSRYNGPTPSPGCAAAVIRDGQVAFKNGYGFADLERDVKITPSSVFYLASLSKQFTAMSVILLEQRGKLSLDDDIRKWIPEVSDSLGGTITLRHLLWHTSGLRDYFTLLALQGWASDGSYTEQQLLDLVKRQKALNFKPGEKFGYSNTGYALLGVVVKRAAGISLRDFAQKNIFDPLGMKNTQFRDDHRMLIKNRALGYDPGDSRYRLNLPELDVVGDGGAFSTVEDLALWDGNFDSGKVGGKSGVAAMQTAGRLSSGSGTGYALGLNVSMLGGAQAIGMSGSYGGYASSYVRIADPRLSVVALCNTSTASVRLAEQIATLYVPATVGTGELPGISLPTSVIPAGALLRADVSGNLPLADDATESVWLEANYFSEELNQRVTLRFRDGALFMERPQGEPVKFVRTAQWTYTSPDGITLKAVPARDKVVRTFTLTLGRVTDLVFVRQPF
jgi:CubicO group peptidase (beta-lactamase class C family)